MAIESEDEVTIPTRARISVLLLLALMSGVAIVVLFLASVSHFRDNETVEAGNRLSIYTRSLNDTLERFQHLPFVLARDSLIRSAHLAANQDVLNRRLESFALEAGLEAIYYMNRTGLVLAASNHNAPVTFVGRNYGFRPYFLTALKGGRGEFFGVGATTGRPGYFISEPVRDDAGGIVGVIAIKLDMSELQSSWEAGGERVFASNRDGVIVLSSERAWLYRVLSPLTNEQKAAIREERQFDLDALSPFEWRQAGDLEAEVGGQRFVHVAEAADHLGWTVHYLLSERRIHERASLTTVFLGVGLLGLLIVATYLRSRRIKLALRVSQEDRARLQAANRELETAHQELARSSKLAALGQLSASVTHELGQPLSAMKNYIAAAEIGGADNTEKVIEKLKTVLSRMEGITAQLRYFAKPDDKPFRDIALQEVYAGAMEILQHDVTARGATVEEHIDAEAVTVFGDPLRLEQVCVNLMKNGLIALEGSAQKVLRVDIRSEGDRAVLQVEDTGPGLGGRDIMQLQEPFHTTRESGGGMGLGLSIAASIVREHDGTIVATDCQNGGARFVVELPISRGHGTNG